MSATKCLSAEYESPGFMWEQNQDYTIKFCNFKWDISEAVNSVRVEEL